MLVCPLLREGVFLCVNIFRKSLIFNDLRGPGRHKYLALNDLQQNAKKLHFFLALIRFFP